ncbi:MAG: hypothetical protein K0M69_00550 [Youngiibacter sp.]|nr:hypothetical protein [Youngiibacter sp.]
MGRQAILSKEELDKAFEMHKEGMYYWQIGKQLYVGAETVRCGLIRNGYPVKRRFER